MSREQQFCEKLDKLIFVYLTVLYLNFIFKHHDITLHLFNIVFNYETKERKSIQNFIYVYVNYNCEV